MRSKRKSFQTIMLIMMVFAALGTATALAAEQWTPISGNEFNMVAYGKVIVQSVDFSAGGFVLYSFGPGGDQDCRSKSEIKVDGSFYATILGNETGARITFKVVGPDGAVYDMAKEIRFQADATKADLIIN